MIDSSSYILCKKYLNQEVEIIIDRPLGSKHPKHGFTYEANYGYLAGVTAADGEDLDAYYLGVSMPLQKAKGKVIAIIHRLNDNDDKLVIVSNRVQNLTDEEILKSVHFQEQWFKSEIIRR